MNLSLWVSWLTFTTGRRALQRGKSRISGRRSLRLAQVSILVSLLLPLALLIVPRQLPFLNFTLIQDHDAMERTADGGRISSITKVSSSVSRAKETEMAKLIRNFPKRNSLWLMLFSVGCFLGISRTGWGLNQLRTALLRCHPFKKMGRVHLLISGDDHVPFATRSLFRIYIVVPGHLLGFPHYLKLAIRHEIQHHRQGDTIWMFIVEVLKVLFFLNPAIHLWARETAESQELACDEALVTSRGVAAYDYGACLIFVAEATLPNRLGLFGTAGMGCGSSVPKSLLSSFCRESGCLRQPDSTETILSEAKDLVELGRDVAEDALPIGTFMSGTKMIVRSDENRKTKKGLCLRADE
jgi:hypothetical protein